MGDSLKTTYFYPLFTLLLVLVYGISPPMGRFQDLGLKCFFSQQEEWSLVFAGDGLPGKLNPSACQYYLTLDLTSH